MKARLSKHFLISDLGPLCYFLRIKVSSWSRKVIQDLLAHVALSDKRIVGTPTEPTSTFVTTSAPWESA